MMRFWRVLYSALLVVTVAQPCGAARAESAGERTAPYREQGIVDDFLLPRRSISPGLLGVNAFANDQRFGSVGAQYREVRSKLRLTKVRILFAWNDDVQPSPNAAPFFGFYDEIASSLPRDVEAVAVLTGIPSWMENPRNWSGGDPRKTFVERWVMPVAARYRTNKRITAWQIWNEPNDPSNTNNDVLGIRENPEGYVELVGSARAGLKRVSPRKKVVSAATTAINQNFPETLEYNRKMLAAGLLDACDVFAFHYYGKSLENVLLPGTAKDFLETVTKPIWVTESGERGTTKQLEYAERVFPYLLGLAPTVRRVYIYQFTEATPADSTYGLRNLTTGRTVSDLYIHLRDYPRR